MTENLPTTAQKLAKIAGPVSHPEAVKFLTLFCLTVWFAVIPLLFVEDIVREFGSEAFFWVRALGVTTMASMVAFQVYLLWKYK